MTVTGQDWSSYQGASPSASGIDFVFVKATESTTYISPDQGSQAAAARAAGAVVGFYAFLHPGDIAAQAQYFVANCDSEPGDILACDWETTDNGTYASCAEKDAFLAAVKSLRPDHRVVLYCNRSFWESIDTTSNCADGLWIATAGLPAGQPGIQHPWTFHQYSDSGGVDHDVANFPTAAALRSWAADTTPTEDDMTPAQAAQLAALFDNLTNIDRTGPITTPETHAAGFFLAVGEGHAHEASEKADTLLAAVAALAATVDTLAADVAELKAGA